MATILLKYDARNSLAKKLVDVLITSGVFTIKQSEGGELKKSLQDIEDGKLIPVKNGKDALRKCLE